MAEVVAIKQTAPQGPVASETANGILRLTLASPPANALSLAMMAALKAEIGRASCRERVSECV